MAGHIRASIRRLQGDLHTTNSLTVIMPTHNEALTIRRAVLEVLGLTTTFPLELIVVDDGSTDSTEEVLSQIEDDRLVVIRHVQNIGKGAAVLTGASRASATHMVIFDADLEYKATDIPRVFQPVLDHEAEVIYGVRRHGHNTVYQSLNTLSELV